ncbi:MAG: oxepin-CoA hydrolase, alternative type [Granulosicoccus sp.]
MSSLAYCQDLGDRLMVVNNNPGKRNVLSAQYYDVVRQAMKIASSEARICCVILRGEGNFFCAGGDLRQLQTARDMNREQRLARIDDLHSVVRCITDCSKPVIAAIEGGAAGAGVSIAFACDLVVASREARFTVAYVKAGLVPDGGLTHHLAQHMPRAALMRMALLGEPVAAQRLYDLGAISDLVGQGEALASALTLADQLAAGPSATQGVIKALVNQASAGDLDAQLNRERDAMVDALVSEEAGEGIDGFLEKRAPDFGRLRDL